MGYLLLRFNGSKTGSNGAGSSGSNTAAATTWPKLHLLLASLALDQKSKLSHAGTTGRPVLAVVSVVLVASTSGSSGPEGPHQWLQWSWWSPPVVPVALMVLTSGSSGPGGLHQWFQWPPPHMALWSSCVCVCRAACLTASVNRMTHKHTHVHTSHKSLCVSQRTFSLCPILRRPSIGPHQENMQTNFF